MDSHIVIIEGIRTSIHALKPADVDECDKLILILPGNPGLGMFYKVFMESLYKKLKGVELAVIGHAGHSIHVQKVDERLKASETAAQVEDVDQSNLNLEEPGRLYNLREQVDHKIAYIRKRWKQTPNLKVILIGHSVGAYIGLEILHELKDDRIERVWGLYPTIMNIGSTINGIKLLPLFHARGVVACFAGFLNLLPEALCKVLLRVRFGADQAATIDTVMDMLSYSTINNILYMGHEEMKNIKMLNIECLKAHQDKIILYYAPGDCWTFDKANRCDHYHQMAVYDDELPNLTKFYCTDNTKHDFCTSPAESIVVAEKAVDWVKHTWEDNVLP